VPSTKAKSSRSDIAHGVAESGGNSPCAIRSSTISCGRLNSLNRVLPRVPIDEDAQFGDFSDPAAVDLAAEFDGELHNHSLVLIDRAIHLYTLWATIL
jgi:hypothetical protein